VGKPLACGIIGLFIDKVQPSSVSFVTEHVFEKKTLRNAIMFVAEGKVPGGGTLSKGAAVVQGILSPGGVSFLGPKGVTGANIELMNMEIFFQQWPGGVTVGFGATPEDTSFGELGHPAPNLNAANLQVVDADLNAIKNFVRPLWIPSGCHAGH
jgi:hypothetical protein